MDKDILTITQEDDYIDVKIPDRDLAVMTLTDIIWDRVQHRSQMGLDMLFSVVVHTLARDLSGKFQEEFIENIRKTIPQYQNAYKKLREEMMKKAS